MVSVSISELKAKLSEHVRRVKGGQQVVVTDRGRPVAVLAPLPERMAEDARLQELAAAGLIKLGGPIPEDFWDLPMPADPKGEVLKALLEERGEGW